MKTVWYIMFVLSSSGEVVTTQEFFGQPACNRALHELERQKAKHESFCTPKSLGIYGVQE